MAGDIFYSQVDENLAHELNARAAAGLGPTDAELSKADRKAAKVAKKAAAKAAKKAAAKAERKAAKKAEKKDKKQLDKEKAEKIARKLGIIN